MGAILEVLLFAPEQLQYEGLLDVGLPKDRGRHGSPQQFQHIFALCYLSDVAHILQMYTQAEASKKRGESADARYVPASTTYSCVRPLRGANTTSACTGKEARLCEVQLAAMFV